MRRDKGLRDPETCVTKHSRNPFQAGSAASYQALEPVDQILEGLIELFG